MIDETAGLAAADWIDSTVRLHRPDLLTVREIAEILAPVYMSFESVWGSVHARQTFADVAGRDALWRDHLRDRILAALGLRNTALVTILLGVLTGLQTIADLDVVRAAVRFWTLPDAARRLRA